MRFARRGPSRDWVHDLYAVSIGLLFFFFLRLAARSRRVPQQTTKTNPLQAMDRFYFPVEMTVRRRPKLRPQRQHPSNWPDPPKAAVVPAKATLATDAERTSLTYSSYDFEVHLEPSQHSIAVHAPMVARNNSDKALGRVALQLSSSLHWESMEVDGKPTKFEIETVASDIDHTGELTEAVSELEAPLAPGASIRMNAIYSGTVVPSAERLLRLGAPAKIANSSEWDAIDPNFTALRGFRECNLVSCFNGTGAAWTGIGNV